MKSLSSRNLHVTTFTLSYRVQSSLHDEFQSSKSSKSKATHSTSSKSGKSKSEDTTAYIVSKSGKGEHSSAIGSSMSHSLSMSSSYSMPEDEESYAPRIEQNSFETDQPTMVSNAPTSSPSLDTDFVFSSDQESTVSEIRSSNSGATPRSLVTLLMLLLLQLVV